MEADRNIKYFNKKLPKDNGETPLRSLKWMIGRKVQTIQGLRILYFSISKILTPITILSLQEDMFDKFLSDDEIALFQNPFLKRK